jgi:hypothetical protein
MSATPDAGVASDDDAYVDAEVAGVSDDRASPAGPASCPNCGTLRAGSYCAACGQKAMPMAPTLSYFVHELTHELLHVDGKIFRSLRLLLTRPGMLTREIFAGRRASYISPIRLYLIASILAFAASALFGRFGEVDFSYTPDAGETVDPAMLERAAEVERTISAALTVWMPRAMFVLVPLFAALVMLFRRRGGHTYPQHLYFALHVHAAWFFAVAAKESVEAVPLSLVAAAGGILAWLYIVVYFPVAFSRVYETTILGTLWRTATIGVLYVAMLFATVLAIVAPTVWPFFFGPSP